MIKAVIFDCFGVLTTESFIAFRDKYMADEAKKTKANDTMDQLNKAEINYETFLSELAKLSETPKEEVEKLLSTSQPNHLLFDLIRTQLKPKYKIGLLSNAGNDWLEELFAPEDIVLFDDKVLSFEHGLIKPEPQIYLLAAKRLGVEPTECIFVDDAQRHCDGAQAVGMKAIRYQDFNQIKVDLEKLLARAGADN